MSNIRFPWGETALHGLATSMVGQEHVGVLGGLLVRLARFLGGDPALWFTVTSAAQGTSVGLPDLPVAQSAVLQVTTQAIQYRIDGGPVQASDPVVPVGSTITLTGRPTLVAFRFQSTNLSAASLTGAYYD